VVRGTLGVGLLVVVAVLLAACSAAPVPDVPALPGLPAAQYPFPPAPPARQLPLDPVVDMALRDIADTLAAGSLNGDAVDTVAASGDSRLAWLVSDLLRFVRGGDEEDRLCSFGQRAARRARPRRRIADHRVLPGRRRALDGVVLGVVTDDALRTELATRFGVRVG